MITIDLGIWLQMLTEQRELELKLSSKDLEIARLQAHVAALAADKFNRDRQIQELKDRIDAMLS